jgi:hypothetical protein
LFGIEMAILGLGWVLRVDFLRDLFERTIVNLRWFRISTGWSTVEFNPCL